MIEDWILSPFWAPIIFVLIYSIRAFLTSWFHWHTTELEREFATRELARAMEAHAEQEEAHARAEEESKFLWPFDY